MAITQNPIIGRTKKSFSENTFYTLNGQNILRSKAVAVANPRTPAQQMQRARFEGFTSLANTLPDNELNLIIPTKEPRQNRRSTLQQQLSVAFGSTINPDSTDAKAYIATFDISLLDKIGTGGIGYTGDYVELPITADSVTLTGQSCDELVERIVAESVNDNVVLVAISEDGCQIQVVDPDLTVTTLAGAAETAIKFDRLQGHGTKVYMYALPCKKMADAAYGSFIIIKRGQKTGRGKHTSEPVSQG